MANKAMQQAREQIKELIEAAQTGAIIPIRLPRQLEELGQSLDEAEKAHQEDFDALKKLPGGDAGTIIMENAEFLKTAIHELRTPMTSIRGYADMLNSPSMGGELTDMQQQLLQVIRTNSRRMESLLSDMSYINKIRANILPLNNKMDMYKNIALMMDKQAQPLAEDLNRALEFITPDGLPLLNTDGELFAHAMSKLIENGLRYSPEGSGKVTVSAEADNGTLIVKIIDNGIGMSDEELGHLGELYYRADNDIVRMFKGSGMGIPIAYGILELINATVAVESELEKGTTFTISLQGMT